MAPKISYEEMRDGDAEYKELLEQQRIVVAKRAARKKSMAKCRILVAKQVARKKHNTNKPSSLDYQMQKYLRKSGVK